MRIIMYIFKKEITEIWRDKTLLVIFTLPLILFSFLNINMQFITQDNLFLSDYRIACINLDEQMTKLLTQPNITIISSSTPYQLLSENKIDCIIEKDDTGNILFIYHSSSLLSRTSTAKLASELGEKLFAMEKEKYTDLPICFIRDENGRDGTDISTMTALMMPTVFILLICHSGSSFVNDLFAGEKERGTLEILLLSGINRIYLFLGKALCIAVISLLDFAICLINYWAFFSDNTSPLFKSGLILSMTSFVLLLTFCTLAVSLICPNRRSAQIVNELITAIPVVGVFYFVFSDFKKIELCFVPFLNSLMMFCGGFEHFGFSGFVLSALTNLLSCLAILLFARFYLYSEKILST